MAVQEYLGWIKVRSPLFLSGDHPLTDCPASPECQLVRYPFLSK